MKPATGHEIQILAVGKVAANAIAWRYDGQLQVTAIVKATFAFAHESVMPLAEPQEIFAEEVRHGRNPARSVRFASDLMPQQRRVDVLFTGNAHAPSNSPVTSMQVRLGLSDGHNMLLDKPLLVKKNSGFRTMSLTYENAFGGIGYAENPFGRGMDDEDEPPSIIDPAHPRRAVGFGPLSRTLITRKRLLGSAPAPNFGAGITTLPATINWEYFQVAPEDQRIHALRGDEHIILEGLHGRLPKVQLRLPGVRGFARIHGLTHAGGSDGTLLQMHATTLHISGDEERCMVTFRASFPVASEQTLSSLRIFAGVELPGETITWPDPSTALQSSGSAKPKRTTVPLFSNDATMMLDDEDVEFLDDEPAAPKPAGISDETSFLSDSHVRIAPGKALPFAKARGDEAASLPVLGHKAPAPDAGNTLCIDIDAAHPAPATPAFVAPPQPPLVAVTPAMPAFVAPPQPPEPMTPPPVMASPVAAQPPAPVAAVWAPSPSAPVAPAPKKRPRPPPPQKYDVRAKLYGARLKPR